jgi:hypothetical protein
MNAQALWGWLWQKFNSAPVPPIPQLLTLKETASDYKLTETINSHKHACTILIEGMSGRSSCPEHRKASSRILLPGRNAECGVLTMEEGPGGWLNTREQLQWLWKIMSNSYVRDTEAVVEISAAPNFIIQDNLARQAKQSKSAKKRALEKGQGRDVGAEVKQEESFEAQKKNVQRCKSNSRCCHLLSLPTNPGATNTRLPNALPQLRLCQGIKRAQYCLATVARNFAHYCKLAVAQQFAN